ALALVSLFGNCIESINLIHPAHEGLHTEEILLSQLGIQQARLLIWGDILGLSSPPAVTGITHAVPLHPGAWNPEPDKPVNFGPRDARLENQGLRMLITDALNGIVEPIRDFSRTKMLHTYGLEHYFVASNLPKEQAALVNFRLDAFREKHTLLRDVATTQFPNMAKRKHEPPKQSWAVHDQTKFAALLTLIRENVDYLIQLMDLQSRVDRSMKLDIRAMGWHPSDDIVRISRDTWKLSLMREATEDMYPEYSDAAQEALDNI
ncbi:prion-inhibition and propagation, helo domain-containing protein, partial [Delphinella strobiligena]